MARGRHINCALFGVGTRRPQWICRFLRAMVALFPNGSATFTDSVAITGAKSFTLWDYLDRINAVVLFTTDGDRTGFLLLQRANGRQIRLAAEPSLSPDRSRLVTADFCATGCDGEVVVWRVDRDSV